MKPVNILFPLFIVVAVVQIAAPASMILRRERALDRGERFLFRTAPVDPYDAFRGRYVAPSFRGRRVRDGRPRGVET